MGVRAAGMPFGSYAAEDAVNPARREEIYKQALEAMVEVSRHAKRAGLSNILIEPVPLKTEFPPSAEDSLRLMKDLDGQTDVPVRLLVDRGQPSSIRCSATTRRWIIGWTSSALASIPSTSSSRTAITTATGRSPARAPSPARRSRISESGAA